MLKEDLTGRPCFIPQVTIITLISVVAHMEKDSPVDIVAIEKEQKTRGRSITTDFENDNVMRTKRANRWRSVVF